MQRGPTWTGRLLLAVLSLGSFAYAPRAFAQG